MSKTTTNYGFIQPAQEDNYDIETQNENMNMIDRQLKTVSDSVFTKTNEVKEWTKETYSNPNLLINGDFQVWQRGTSFINPKYERYCADRFKLYSQSEASVEKDGVWLRLRAGTTNVSAISYSLEVQPWMLGKKMTVSYWIKASEEYTNAFIIFNGNSYASEKIYFTKSIVPGPIEKKFIATFTMPETVNDNIINLWFVRSSNQARTIWIRDCKLELGEVATPLIHRLYGQELALCQRYYEYCWNSYQDNLNGLASGAGVRADMIATNVTFKVTKRIKPVVKVFGRQGTEGNVSIFGGPQEVGDGKYSVTSGINGFHGLNATDSTVKFEVGKWYQFGWEADAEI